MDKLAAITLAGISIILIFTAAFLMTRDVHKTCPLSDTFGGEQVQMSATRGSCPLPQAYEKDWSCGENCR